MRLNVKKIQYELNRIDKTQAWLAAQMGKHKQWVNYLMKNNAGNVTLKTIERIGHALAIDPKDLII